MGAQERSDDARRGTAPAVLEPTVEVRGDTPDDDANRRELIGALTSTPRWLPSRYFYDEVGSDLFDQITELPEYYPTRTERSILEARGTAIAARTGAVQLVELGSGTATKTRVLLEALWTAGTLASYVPLDVDEETLRLAAAAIAREHPGLAVCGIVGDFRTHLAPLPPAAGPRLIIFLGGTIGNLHPRREAPAFVAEVAAAMAPGDHFLLGVDLVKEVAQIEAAYDDSRGITAEFNRNILRVVNGILGADFDPSRFRHRAFFDRDESWIEMRLVSEGPQRVRLVPGGPTIDLDEGEEMRTEISAKYELPGIEALLRRGGLHPTTTYTDADQAFALALAAKI